MRIKAVRWWEKLEILVGKGLSMKCGEREIF